MRSLGWCFISMTVMACGGVEGTAPKISGLKITTSPVVRGQQAQGETTVADADGVKGLELQLGFTGPASFTATVPVQGTTEEIKEAQVPFVFMISAAAPAGEYTLSVSAIDLTDRQSNALSTNLVVK